MQLINGHHVESNDSGSNSRVVYDTQQALPRNRLVVTLYIRALAGFGAIAYMHVHYIDVVLTPLLLSESQKTPNAVFFLNGVFS